MEKDDKTEQNQSKDVLKVNKNLQEVKSNSWVGHLSDDTTELEYIMDSLKKMIDEGELEGIDKVKALKQLQDLDNEKAKRAMHLDNLLIKSMAIGALSPEKQKEVKDLW